MGVENGQVESREKKILDMFNHAVNLDKWNTLPNSWLGIYDDPESSAEEIEKEKNNKFRNGWFYLVEGLVKEWKDISVDSEDLAVVEDELHKINEHSIELKKKHGEIVTEILEDDDFIKLAELYGLGEGQTIMFFSNMYRFGVNTLKKFLWGIEEVQNRFNNDESGFNVSVIDNVVPFIEKIRGIKKERLSRSIDDVESGEKILGIIIRDLISKK